ncbi:MAG: hypothetical protein IJA89_06030 [Clostridia bacterium]|nr:hypothetical protein [Clostridia bacterium]
MKMMKRFVSLFLLSVIAAFAVGCSPKVSKNINIWTNAEYSELNYGKSLEIMMPTPQEVGVYNKVDFYIMEGRSFFKYAEFAYCLQLEYEEQQYFQEKEKVLSEKKFLDEIILLKNGTYEMPITECTLGDFHIKILNVEDEQANDAQHYPGTFGFIAFNDDMRIIRYCYLVQMSLDYFESKKQCVDYIEKSLNLEW